jgi:hypothetical protein
MTPRRVLQIRCVLLVVAALACLLFGPRLIGSSIAGVALYAMFAMNPLGLMMPVFGSACAACTGTTPSNFQVVITGVVNGTGSNCTLLNNTFVLPFETGSVPGAVPTRCRWAFEPISPAPTCGALSVNRVIFSYDLGFSTISQFVRSDGNPDNTYGGTMAGEPTPEDCTTISGHVLSVTGSGFCCNHGSATCTVTAL